MIENLNNEKYVVWLYNASSRTFSTFFKSLDNDYFELSDVGDFGPFYDLKNSELLGRPDLLICEDGTKLPPDIKRILTDSCCGVAYVTNKPNERQTENMFNHVFELTDEPITVEVMRGRTPVTINTTKKDLNISQMIDMAQMANVSKITKVVQKHADYAMKTMHVDDEIEHGQSLSDLKKNFLRKVGTRLNMFIDMKDNYTYNHCQRVAEYSEILGRALGLEEDKVDELTLAAELHDIGKLGLPTAVINKTTKLNDEEFKWMKHHTDLGVKIFPDLKCTTLYGGIRSHHEKYDGSGYPDGLAGDQIPYFGQIIAIADSFDAMTSQRSYNKVKSAEEAFKDLIDHKGTWYNPELVDVFVKSMKENKEIMKKLEEAKIEADKRCSEKDAKVVQKTRLDEKFKTLIKGGK